MRFTQVQRIQLEIKKRCFHIHQGKFALVKTPPFWVTKHVL